MLRTFVAGLVFGLLAFSCSTGCGSTAIDTAIHAANGAREVEVTAGDVLRERCTETYARVTTAGQLATLDEVCVPARKTYGALRSARLMLVAAITVAQSGGSDASLLPAAAALARAAQSAADTAAALEQ